MATLVQDESNSATVYCSLEGSLSTPPYSLLPAKSELSLHTRHPLSEGSRTKWCYETRHMKIKLVTCRWGTSAPTYGMHGAVEGTVTILGHHPDHIHDITVTLEGSVASSTLTNGSPINETIVFMSHSIPIQLPETRTHGDQHPFSIPIPSEIDVQGVTTPAPPSFFRFQNGIIGEVNYALKVSMSRHGNMRFRADESKTISILYLPKSRPAEPPLARIPKPLERITESPDLYVSEHVSTHPLIPQWPDTTPSPKRSSSNLEPFKKSIYFSIPAPQCFASGDKIPFFLSLVFPSSPVQAAMYSQNVHVALCKRMILAAPRSSLRKLLMRRSWSASKSNQAGDTHMSHLNTSTDTEDEDDHPEGLRSSKTLTSDSLSRVLDPYHHISDSIRREWCISIGLMETRSEYSEGVYLLRGTLTAGDVGRECSWNVGSIAKVQYFIRVTVDCPEHLKEHLPDFTFEQDVELTTDCWEAMNREVRSMGGLPAPALGLVRDLQRDVGEF